MVAPSAAGEETSVCRIWQIYTFNDNAQHWLAAIRMRLLDSSEPACHREAMDISKCKRSVFPFSQQLGQFTLPHHCSCYDNNNGATMTSGCWTQVWELVWEQQNDIPITLGGKKNRTSKFRRRRRTDR